MAANNSSHNSKFNNYKIKQVVEWIKNSRNLLPLKLVKMLLVKEFILKEQLKKFEDGPKRNLYCMKSL